MGEERDWDVTEQVVMILFPARICSIARVPGDGYCYAALHGAHNHHYVTRMLR